MLLPGTLTEKFCFLIREPEMLPLIFHGLRHAFATMASQAGINPKVVAIPRGHSSVIITLDTYSQVLPNMQDELAVAVENRQKRHLDFRYCKTGDSIPLCTSLLVGNNTAGPF